MILNMKYILIILTLTSLCQRIVQGTFTVQVLTNSKYEHLCAGAHINDVQYRGKNDIYLTSAHCLLENNITKPEQLSVRRVKDEDHSYHGIKAFFMHPLWNSNETTHLLGDLAILVGEKPNTDTKTPYKDHVLIRIPNEHYYPNGKILHFIIVDARVLHILLVAYFDKCTLHGFTKGNMESPSIIPISVISAGECYSAWKTYSETGNHICTRNDFNQTCFVIIL